MDKTAISYETARAVGEQRALQGKSTELAVRGMQRARGKALLEAALRAESNVELGRAAPKVKKPPSKLISALGTLLGRGYVAAKVMTGGKL